MNYKAKKIDGGTWSIGKVRFSISARVSVSRTVLADYLKYLCTKIDVDSTDSSAFRDGGNDLFSNDIAHSLHESNKQQVKQDFGKVVLRGQSSHYVPLPFPLLLLYCYSKCYTNFL